MLLSYEKLSHYALSGLVYYRLSEAAFSFIASDI